MKKEEEATIREMCGMGYIRGVIILLRPSKFSPVHAYLAHLTVLGTPCFSGTSTRLKLQLGSTVFSTNNGFSSAMNFQHAFSLAALSAA